jgi:HK97 family phage major capsid protein
MTRVNEQLLNEVLQKASLLTSSLGTMGGGTGILAPEQAEKFLQIAVQWTVLGTLANVVTHTAPKWQQPKMFFGTRILARGSEFTRLSVGQQSAPTLGNIELSTNLYRGEVPVSDEFLEDNIEREGFADSLVTMIAQYVGKDLEEVYLRGDTATADTFLNTLDGILKQFINGAGNHTLAAATYGKDYQALFTDLLKLLPVQYRRDPTQLRFFVPISVADGYRDQIANRGTPLGDQQLMGIIPLAYYGIPIVPVPMMIGTAAGDFTDAGNKILLTNPKNIYIGFRRQVRMETFRDPREGGTSFVVNLRTDIKAGHVDASVVATGVV